VLENALKDKDTPKELLPEIRKGVADGKETLGQLQEQATLVKNLNSLKKIDSVQIVLHYIPSDVGRFAKEANKNGPGTVNIYIGHGDAAAGNAEKVDPNALKAVEDELKRTNPAAGNLAVLLPDLLGGITTSAAAIAFDKTPPRFGFYFCFAGRFNNVVSPGNQVPGAPNVMGTSTLSVLAKQFNTSFAAIKKLLEDTAQASPNGKVYLHLYFGDDDSTIATDILNLPQKGANLFFEKW
jgi:hypothetical protein